MYSADLSVVIPAFNEEKSISKLLETIFEVMENNSLDYQIVVVDDASTDDTALIVEKYVSDKLILNRLPKNLGKGAAVQKAIELSSGQFIIVQDADLEYFPSDIPILLEAAKSSSGATIFGSRVLGAKKLKGLRGYLRLWPKQSVASWVFNFVLTGWIFIVRREWITDSLTGYKLYPSDLFKKWKPNTSGFETDHEITSQILNQNLKILELPIDYAPRSKQDGKKIRARDGLVALRTIWVYRK
jgi:glycosyltransferase involved in cell wall biosynthesis